MLKTIFIVLHGVQIDQPTIISLGTYFPSIHFFKNLGDCYLLNLKMFLPFIELVRPDLNVVLSF